MYNVYILQSQTPKQEQHEGKPKKKVLAGGTICEEMKMGHGPEAKPGKMVCIFVYCVDLVTTLIDLSFKPFHIDDNVMVLLALLFQIRYVFVYTQSLTNNYSDVALPPETFMHQKIAS